MALLLAILVFAAARTHADPDLWGHVRFGQDILAFGIPATDTYSYLTAGYPWINHELLAEILFGAAFNQFGVAGLVGLKVSLILIIFGLLFARLRRQGMHSLRAGIVLVVVLMMMSVGLWTIRPQLLTYVFFLLTLLLIDHAESGNRAAAWALPAVILLWTNSHGGFLAGLAVIGIWVTANLLMRFVPSRIHMETSSPGPAALCGVLATSIAATLANPYGVNLLLFLARTATVPRPEISEWQPIAIGSRLGAVYLIALVASVIALLRSKRPVRLPLIAVFCATALLPLLALRHLPLFGLSFAVLISEHLSEVWNRYAPSAGPPTRRLPVALTFLGSIVFFGAAVPHFSCVRIDPTFIRFPARAVALLKQSGVQGNAATFFDWGEYMIWHLSPQVRVSIDGRRETVYSPESYSQGMDFLYGIGKWDAVLENPSTTIALVGRDQPTYNLMRLKPGWVLVYEDALSGLFAKEGSPEAEAIRAAVPSDLPPDGAGLCFP